MPRKGKPRDSARPSPAGASEGSGLRDFRRFTVHLGKTLKVDPAVAGKLRRGEDAPEFLASWTFHRGQESLTIQREAIPGGGLRLIVVENGKSREFKFASLARLVPFQSEMESWLLDGGWSLAEFAPDRRQGRDRREMIRMTTDRRRWWTTVKPR